MVKDKTAPVERGVKGRSVRWRVGLLVGVIVAGALSTATAQQTSNTPTGGEVFSDFLACEAVPDPTEQLVCFRTALKKYKRRFGLSPGLVEDAARDQPAAVMRPAAPGRAARAEAAPGVVDRPGAAAVPAPAPADASPRAVREYRKALAQATPKRVEGVIVSAARDPLGYWIFTLDNGQVWKETAKSSLRDSRFEGRRATIKKGLFGGWQIKVEGIGASGRVVRLR